MGTIFRHGGEEKWPGRNLQGSSGKSQTSEAEQGTGARDRGGGEVENVMGPEPFGAGGSVPTLK